MKAIFLVGGIGKRMLPITTEKCLLRFCGKTLMEHQLSMAESAGVKDSIIVASPLNADEIKTVVGKRAEIAIQKEPKGMADAVLSARHLVDGKDEILIVGANDIVEKSAYEGIAKAPGTSRMLGYKVKEYFPGGYLTTDGDRVKGIVEKPGAGNEPSDLVNLVFHLHTEPDRLFKQLEEASSSKDDVYEVALDSMITGGADFRAVPYTGEWVPIKYPWHVLDASRFFLERMDAVIPDSTSISEKATITGNVCLGENVRVFPGATISGNVYIGGGSIVGNNSLVRENTHMGERCAAGYGTEIKGSYIADDCWFHTNYIGDSIIMDGCMFGSGAVTANFRFDEKPVYMQINGEKVDTGRDKFGCAVGARTKAGINCSIYPGVKIGQDSLIGPGVVLRQDVEVGAYVYLRQEYEMRENRAATRADKKMKLMKKLRGKD